MPGLETYPAPYRQSIRAVSELLDTDYESAYFTILLESVMTDIDPADPAILDLIIRYEQHDV